MGCVVSDRRSKETMRDIYLTPNTTVRADSDVPYPVYMDDLTSEQKHLVSSTWQIVSDDIARVGVITFMRLFEKHPELQDLFVPFRGLSSDELRSNVRLREHGLRVMGTIEKGIARLYKPGKLYNMLFDLGSKHRMFDTKVEHFELIGPVLLQTIKPTIGEKWTPEVESAWLKFFWMIATVMTEGMTDVPHNS
ncbi:neuroglobin-like [Pecten maximus]|uniref:neuroglobin-like n=1 Tax=Pecten maximus TaxID=6579 RepID=UPI001458C726|nr:neuroglobin-like [Pecten maximus]